MVIALAAQQSDLRALVLILTLMSNTGIRLSELIRLRWDHIDLDRRRITVERGIAAERRIVPFGPKTFRILSEFRESSPDSDLVLGPAAVGSVRRAARQLRRLGRQLCLPTINFEMFRHSFVHRWFALGCSLEAFQQIVGWRCSLYRKSLCSPSLDDIARDQEKVEE